MLPNKARACEFVDRHELDGLLAQLSINTYYLSDYWGSVHIEDTVVITKNGCDPLTSLDLKLQVVA